MQRKLFALATAAVALSGSVANAHASLKEKSAEAGSYYVATLKVPHGCEGEATKKVRVTIPEGVIGVKLMPKAGWDLAVMTGAYQNTYANHGKNILDGVIELIWAGELLDSHYEEFTFSTKLTDAFKAGDTVCFLTRQECDTGEVYWHEIPAEGQDPHDLRRPAPGVKITGGHEHP